MKGLKQSTVATVIVGPVLDSTGAAVTNAVVGDFRLAKNGTVATLSGATVTHDANGYYLIALTTGNTDTTGRLVLTSGNTAHSMASHHWSVLPASVFDAIYTNATNSTGGLATATGTITALAGAISTLTAPQVRTELATELGRIDVATSTRMATYTQPTGFLGATFPTTVASPTNIDKTGFKLASDGLSLVTAWTVDITGNLTGNVTGSVGSISGVTFPANFGSLDITVGGAIAELGTGALTANGAGDAIETYVWGALLANHTAANSFGARIIRSANSNNTVQISGGGSNHIFAVLHDAEPNSIPEDAFQTGALSARVLADGAIDASSIASGALNGKGDWLTTLGTNAPANWINAAAIAASALNGKGDWLTTLGANAPAGWINDPAIASDAVTKITVNLFKYGDVQRWTSPANQLNVTITKVS